MLLNGVVVGEQDAPKAFANRGFLVADGVFESMRFTDNRVPFLGLHVARLHAAMEAHGMNIPDSLQESHLKESLEAWRQTWPFDGDARIRLTAYREGQGKYTPDTDDTSWVATVERMDARGFSLAPKGLDVDIYQDMHKHVSPVSRYKNIASTVYVHAARHARIQGWGDALILNADQKIIESSRSNLFVVSNGVLYTPVWTTGAWAASCAPC